MKCMKMITALLVLLVVTVISVSAEATNKEYCLSNFTATPERCLCNASNDWKDQENVYSAQKLLEKSCRQVIMNLYI